MPTVNFTTPGSDTFTWKDGVSKADVQCRGGGGGSAYGAADLGGQAGNGGDYAEKLQISRSGATDTVVVGGGGAGGTSGSPSGVAGGDSYFRNSGTVLAKGGGSAGTTTGDTTFTGGTGGGNGGFAFAGGGGGGAGDGANGGNGTDAEVDAGGSGGSGGTAGGGAGGAGSIIPSEAGGSPGGGGGGGHAGNDGAAGANGQVVVDTVAGNLAFNVQPSNADSGVAISPSITVLIRRTDAANATDTDATGNVTLSIASGSGVIGGTVTRAAVAGVATFDDITVTGNGAHTLQAAHADCTSATSASFTITGVAAAASKNLLLLDVG